MNRNHYTRYVSLRGTRIVVHLPDEPVLEFSPQLPARKLASGGSYSEKGWMWCAFQAALQEARIDAEDYPGLFDAIWEMFR